MQRVVPLVDKTIRIDQSLYPVAVGANGVSGTLVLPDMTSSPFEVARRFISFVIVTSATIYVSIGTQGSNAPGAINADFVISLAASTTYLPFEIFSDEPVYVFSTVAIVVFPSQYLRMDLTQGPNRGIVNVSGQGAGG